MQNPVKCHPEPGVLMLYDSDLSSTGPPIYVPVGLFGVSDQPIYFLYKISNLKRFARALIYPFYLF